MELKEIVSVSGKNGLHKVIAQTNRGFIVESLDGTKARFPVNITHQVALLDEITIYTESGENLPLKTVFENIKNTESEKPVPTGKEDPVTIRDFFTSVAPDFDRDRVYISDMKKILKWYDILKTNHLT